MELGSAKMSSSISGILEEVQFIYRFSCFKSLLL